MKVMLILWILHILYITLIIPQISIQSIYELHTYANVRFFVYLFLSSWMFEPVYAHFN